MESFTTEIGARIAKFPSKRDKVKASFRAEGSFEALNSHHVKQKKKEERKAKIVKAYSCKKEVYENCKMVAPDGELLSNCDFKKAQWYIDKGLAEKISDKPFVIRLNFEPNGRTGTVKPH